MPKMPPVPVALPPPSRYANEEKGGDKSKRERGVESLYKTVSKASPKSKHVSKSLQTREDDNIEDLYAQVKSYFIFFHFLSLLISNKSSFGLDKLKTKVA